MARNSTLIHLLDMYRAEARVSRNPASNVQTRDTQVSLIQRVQERLWDEIHWPHLEVKRDILLQSGQRYYDTPEDILIENIITLEVFTDGTWRPLTPNIESWHLDTYNSDLDQRAYPPVRWSIHEDEDIEIWPISDQNGDADTLEGTLRFTGIRNLRPLVEDGDRADLDDRMITLFAAAETLAAQGAPDAQVKLDQANAIKRRKCSGLKPRRKFQMFGIGHTPAPTKMRVGHYRSLWGND